MSLAFPSPRDLYFRTALFLADSPNCGISTSLIDHFYDALSLSRALPLSAVVTKNPPQEDLTGLQMAAWIVAATAAPIRLFH
jgi:hypothetical protein